MAVHVTRVVLNRRNLGRILKGQEGTVKRDLDHRGKAIADRANGQASAGKVDLSKPGDTGGGLYQSEGFVGRARYRNTVRSVHPVVVANSPLLRSIDAGRSPL